MDPVASLRPAEIDVEIGDWEYTVPALSAAEWLEVLAQKSPAAIVPGLLEDEDRLAVLQDYLRGAVTAQDMVDASRRVLEVAGGWKWWSVQRLVDSAMLSDVWPTIHGKMIMKGVDLNQMTLAGFVNAVWVIALGSCQKDSERSALEWEITKPPPGHADELEETDEADFQAIMADQARLTGG